MKQFEVDKGNKIFLGPSEALFKYLQKMCNSNQETMLCPKCSTVFDSKAAKAFESSEIKKKLEAGRGKGKEMQFLQMFLSSKLLLERLNRIIRVRGPICHLTRFLRLSG